MSHGTPEHADAGAHGRTAGTGIAKVDAHAEHGHAALPPEPAERHITPAPEDFRNLPGPSALFWPFLWIGIAILLIAALRSAGWPVSHSDHADVHHGDASHGEPATR
jgi:hypothetical protein